MQETYNTRQTLLERIKDPNDSDAWEEFINFYKNYIYVIIRSMDISSHDADDILQQVTLKLWKNLPEHKHNPECGRFRSWVSTVTRNCVISFIRKQTTRASKLEETKRREELEYLNSIKLPEIEEIAQREWEVFITNTALKNLEPHFTPQALEAFRKHATGVSADEIADQLKVSRDCVYKYISRVKVRFINQIKVLREELDF